MQGRARFAIRETDALQLPVFHRADQSASDRVFRKDLVVSTRERIQRWVSW